MTLVFHKLQRFLERMAISNFSRMFYVVKHWYRASVDVLDMSLRLRILTTYSDLHMVWKGIRVKLSLRIPSGYMGSRGTDPLILILSSKGRWDSTTLF
jgi:hypothetical protein